MRNVWVFQFNTPSSRNYLPLAAGLLASTARRDARVASEFRIHISMLREPPSAIVSALQDPAVLAFSCYMWNLQHSLEVARLAKERFPSALVLMGGPSIPRDRRLAEAFFARNPFVDVLGFGEGEMTFSALLNALATGGDPSAVEGIAYRHPSDPDRTEFTPPRPRLTSLEAIGSPFLDGTFDELLATSRATNAGVILETNRGCPFGCTFCDWGQATQSRVIEFPMERVRQELQWAADRRIVSVTGADANFGIRQRDQEIAELVASLKRTTGYPSELVMNWVKNSPVRVINIAQTLLDAGIRCYVTVTMQSFNEPTLVAVKRKNIHLKMLDQVKVTFQERKVPTYGELILGLPSETYDSFVKGVVDSISPFSGDNFIINLCRLLENAELSSEEHRTRYGIETRRCEMRLPQRDFDDSSITEFEEIVVGTGSMPNPDWQRAFTFGFFSSLSYNLQLADQVLRLLRYVVGVPLVDYIHYLLRESGAGFPVLGGIKATLGRFISSVMAGGPVALKDERFGQWFWQPHELCFLVVGLQRAEFYRELLALTRQFLAESGREAPDYLEEAFQVQEWSLPTLEHDEPVIKAFEFDWLNYIAGIDAVPRLAPRSVAFVPPGYLAPIPQLGLERRARSSDRAQFAINQLYRAGAGGIVRNLMRPVEPAERA